MAKLCLVYRSYFTCVVSESVKYTRRACFRTGEWDGFPGKAIIPGKYCAVRVSGCWRCRAQCVGFSGKCDSLGKNEGVCSLVRNGYLSLEFIFCVLKIHFGASEVRFVQIFVWWGKFSGGESSRATFRVFLSISELIKHSLSLLYYSWENLHVNDISLIPGSF